MTLINAIISSPEDLDFRLHLRNEFMRIGLLDVLEVRIGRWINHKWKRTGHGPFYIYSKKRKFETRINIFILQQFYASFYDKTFGFSFIDIDNTLNCQLQH